MAEKYKPATAPRPELSMQLTLVRSSTTHLVSGIRLRTVDCSKAELLEVIFPVQRTIVSSGFFVSFQIQFQDWAGVADMT